MQVFKRIYRSYVRKLSSAFLIFISAEQKNRKRKKRERIPTSDRISHVFHVIQNAQFAVNGNTSGLGKLKTLQEEESRIRPRFCA
jgi:hypothetical protein